MISTIGWKLVKSFQYVADWYADIEALGTYTGISLLTPKDVDDFSVGGVVVLQVMDSTLLH
jgi:hypothetical protein